jgi:hypothetical protein
VTWILDHDEHDVEEREDAFYCRTCDLVIPKHPPAQIDLRAELVAQDDDLGADIVFKKEW